MATFLVELNGGVTVQYRSRSWAVAWARAVRAFGDNLRSVTAVRIADAA